MMKAATLVAVAVLTACSTTATRSTAVSPSPRVTLATAPDRVMTNGDVRIRFRDSGGPGEPVVVIHGFTRDLADWLILGDSISLDHRVIAVDMRGHGQSSKFAEPTRYGRQMTGDVVRLLDELGIRRAHVVGHSMGALVASSVAARHPDRVITATLVAGPFAPDSATMINASQQWIGELERTGTLKNFFRWIFPQWNDQIATAVNAQMLQTNDATTLLAVMRALGGLAVTPAETSKSRVPALITDGTNDPLLPQSRELAARWPGSRLLEVQGADHASVIASPLVLAAIRQLMAGAR